MRFSVAGALAGAALLASGLPLSTALADSGTDDVVATQDPGWTPTFIRDEGNNSFLSSRTVPFWSSSFTYPKTDGVVYPFTMVGTDPRLVGSTTVPTTIVPLKFNFIAGSQDAMGLTPVAASMDGADNVDATLASPIFTPANFAISHESTPVQYGDAVMRAEFGKVGTGYHVRLGQPDVQDTITLDVPEEMGVAVNKPVVPGDPNIKLPATVPVGLVDRDWFQSQLRHIINTMHLPASTLPIFLSDNVYLYAGDIHPPHCCILGGHGAGSPTGIGGGSLNGKDAKAWRTFVFAAYITPGSFPGFPAPNRGFADIHALSHEVAEWMNDPFGVNKVPAYHLPVQGTCGSELETSDPVVGVWFPIQTVPNGPVWHPADQVFLNWFARNAQDADLSPIGGRFTFSPATSHFPGPYGAFGVPAAAC